jgi:hypothetical protein
MNSRSICVLLLLTANVGGCASALSPSAFEGVGPEMRPEIFFAGATSSSGVLQSRTGVPTRRLHVEGNGQVQPDGSFRLDQSVTFDDDAPTTRIWMMQRLDARRYTASLTDASGLVEGEAYGELFHLRYPMKKPFGGEMEQWMYLQPDGRTVLNEATVRVFGIVVARISEVITRKSVKSAAESIPP